MGREIKENLIQDTTSPEKEGKGFGVEISTDESKKITDELSRINDLISHDGAIKVEDLENLSSVAKQTKIDVGGELMTVEEAEKIPDLKMNVEIWKEMSEGNFENTKWLTRITQKVSKYLENIDGDIKLHRLTSAEGLILPKCCEGDLILGSLTSAHKLKLPTSIGGLLSLNGLTSAEGLTLPTNIGGGLWFDGLTSAEGLILPQSIGGNLSLNGLTSAHNLVLPRTIRGSLSLNGLTSAHGLVLPANIKGHIYLNKLRTIENLVLTEGIEGLIALGSLSTTVIEKLLEKYPQYRDKIM